MMFTTDEIQAGFPAAAQTAGIDDVKTARQHAEPAGTAVRQGRQDGRRARADLPVLTWVLLDQAMRQIGGQELTGDEAKGLPVLQFLRQEDITFDPSKGWTGYPDFPQRFAKLWGVEAPPAP